MKTTAVVLEQPEQLVLSQLAWLRFAQAGIAIPPLSAHPPGVRNPPRSW